MTDVAVTVSFQHFHLMNNASNFLQSRFCFNFKHNERSTSHSFLCKTFFRNHKALFSDWVSFFFFPGKINEWKPIRKLKCFVLP